MGKKIIINSLSSNTTSFSQQINLPPITTKALVDWDSTIGIRQSEVKQEEKHQVRKFFTKSSIVIAALTAPSVLTPKVFKHFPQITKILPKQVAGFAIPIAIGVGIGSALSSVFQVIFNGKISKDFLLSDVKDALITSFCTSGFSLFVSKSNKLISTYKMMDNIKFLKRTLINGSIGSVYTALRGLIKPEEEDKLSFERIAKGFVEGMFLGEGARLMFKHPIGAKIKNQNLYGLLKYTKICLGAALGSIAYRFSEFALSSKAIKSDINKDTFAEHFFKGNSYPTIII